MGKSLLHVTITLLLCYVVCGSVALGRPQAQHGLNYQEPATTWDEALPLGKRGLNVHH